jgi:hypothetical protein
LTRSELRLPSLAKYGSALSTAERQAIARSVVALAAADGEIDPEEVRTLQKIFKDTLQALGELLEVLQSRGFVRPEVTLTQVSTLLYGLFTVVRPDPDRSDEEARSLVAIILRGIRV